MYQQPPKFWNIVVVVAAIVAITIMFTPLIVSRGLSVPNLGADGGKNTFVFLYQVLYGKGVWSTAMNYPYGEHILYTDGQPLISVPLSFLKGLSAGSALQIMWALILFGYFLGIFYLYKILIRFKVKPALALMFAIFICLFSPQIFRIDGHFGLSYPCVIPMLFYWTICYHNCRRWNEPIYIFLLGIIFSFIHPYYSALILVWTSFYCVGYVLTTQNSLIKKMLHIYPLILSMALIFTVFGTFMFLTDPLKDRPVFPYGALVYCSTGEQIITSAFSPIWQLITNNKGLAQGEEGYCYIGFSTIFIILVALITGILNKINTTDFSDESKNSIFHPIWLIIAVFSLLLSMGVPFVWNMEWLLDYFSYLRQFRTLGRFSWIFYYIITIYGVVKLSSLYQNLVSRKKIVPAIILITCVISSWLIETYGYVKHEHEKFDNGYANYKQFFGIKEYSWQNFLAKKNFQPASFQAVLTLKYFNIGSDKQWLGNDAFALGISYSGEAAIQLHLPLVDADMARSSWSVTQKQAKTFAGPFANKPMLNDLNCDKPILLIKVSNETLDPNEAYLLEFSDTIGSFQNNMIYVFYPTRLKEADQKNREMIMKLIPTMRNNDTCTVADNNWYLNHFEYRKGKPKLFGEGALTNCYYNDSILVAIPCHQKNENNIYELSCWFLLRDNNYRSPYLKIEFLDTMNNIIKNQELLVKESKDTKGMWFRGESWFTIPKSCIKIRLRVASNNKGDYVAIDELLMRPGNSIIVSKDKYGNVLVNNHFIN